LIYFDQIIDLKNLLRFLKMLRFFNTIRYLKLKQIYYYFYYNIRKKIRNKRNFSHSPTVINEIISAPLTLIPSIPPSHTVYNDGKFHILNKTKHFEHPIDWNFHDYGKLWTYNLNYFDFLNQKNISSKDGLSLINDYIKQLSYIEDGLEPYPISLRGINWIKFLTRYKIKKKEIDTSLYAQYLILMDNIEYHLMGNHLLENAFSLLFAAHYFRSNLFYSRAKELLFMELEEQVLNDGAHFELSPMYHQIMLYRILDCINLVKNNRWKDDNLLSLLKEKASIMLGWLNIMTFKNGNIPLFNDSAFSVAPNTRELNTYAESLNIKPKYLKLSDSGYRKVEFDHYEMVVDIGNIGPDYIPGHAHSDTFNFELYIDGKPFIVDTGTSTYQASKRRDLERSTFSHNTVEVNSTSQSHIWGGFRVAERAKITSYNESNNTIKATHNGYRKFGVLHTRKFQFDNNTIIVSDTISSNKSTVNIAYLHFFPGIKVIKKGNNLYYNDIILQISKEVIKIKIDVYEYAMEFNKTKKANLVKIFFLNNLELKIIINKNKGRQ